MPLDDNDDDVDVDEWRGRESAWKEERLKKECFIKMKGGTSNELVMDWTK